MAKLSRLSISDIITYLSEVGNMSTTTLFTIDPPILERATNTDEIVNKLLSSLAQYRIPQQLPAPTKQITADQKGI